MIGRRIAWFDVVLCRKLELTVHCGSRSQVRARDKDLDFTRRSYDHRRSSNSQMGVPSTSRTFSYALFNTYNSRTATRTAYT